MARLPTTQDAPAKENQGKSSMALTVTLLASEWDSSKGGFSTFGRQLAIELAKHEQVKVTVLVPQYSCSEEEKRTAKSHNVSIIEAQSRPGFDSLDCLSFPPRDLAIDIILGHGGRLGRQAQVIRESHGCKWVQVVHTAPEELGMYKYYPKAISKGEQTNRTIVDLCKLADAVAAVGPKLKEAYSSYLRSCKEHQDVLQLTPGIFSEFSDVRLAIKEKAFFKVLTFGGRGDPKDFSLKGYDISAKAIVELKDSSYLLLFVGAPIGNQEEVAEHLLQSGISRSQLIVRAFIQRKERLKELFCEVDLAIMPSRTEGFELTALEALSAGLPILVSGNSGFGDALRTLPLGKPFVVDSADPKDWAKAITAVRLKDRTERLQEIQRLRTSYEEKFNWGKQCEALVEKMWSLVHVRDFPFHQWTQGECVGAGNFGKVYKCHVGYDFDNIVAVKIVKMEPQYTETQEEVKALNNEICILKTLRHERIVSFYGSQQKHGHLHLFMDFMAGGSLSAHIKNRGVLPERESQWYTKQLLEGVKFLHSQNVIHRDIKGSNVLLDGKDNVKLADFGLSKMIQKVGSKTNLVSHCGTPYWMAPEIFWGEGYGRKADIWSLGCTVVEMLTGKPPLRDLEPAAAMFRIGSRPIEPTLPDNVSQNAKEFIMEALTWKPDERPWADELLCYAFVDWMANRRPILQYFGQLGVSSN